MVRHPFHDLDTHTVQLCESIAVGKRWLIRAWLDADQLANGWLDQDMTELKRLLIAASLTPGHVALARVAFDIAWSEIAHLYVGTEAISRGRTRLATMVLAVVSEGKTDVESIH